WDDDDGQIDRRIVPRRRSVGLSERIAMKTDGTSPSIKSTESIDDLLNRCATAGVLGISVRTLDRWHRLGFGPPRIRFAGQIRYRLSSLPRWVLSHEAVPQSPPMSGASQGSNKAKMSTPAND